ncbi:hypothetical protein [Fusobacterium animalis]|uniref:hypothetical protein n=1 Tax=Fusobacterium animalis TaxID=76859 RepID=UPI00356AC395
MGKFVTNWDIKDWASFLGSYLGGTLGAFITLYGIKWQVTREESQKERNDLSSFLKALKYNINRNLNDKDLENKIFSSFKIYSYCIEDAEILYDKINFIYPLETNINFDYNKIFKLEKIGEEILNLNEEIKLFNEDYDFLFNNWKKRDEMIKKIKEIEGFESIIKDLEENSKNIFYSPILLKNSKNEKTKLQIKKEILKLRDKIIENIEAILIPLSNKSGSYTEIEIEFIKYYYCIDNLKRYDIFKLFERMEKLKEDIKRKLKKIDGKDN